MKSFSKPFLAFLTLATAILPQLAKAEPERCMPQDALVAQARAERPGTTIVAQYESWEAAAILAVMNGYVVDEVPSADEILVLYSEPTRTVLLIGSELGCARWHGVFPVATYEQVLRKAVGTPV